MKTIDQNLDNALNLALSATEVEREKSLDLNVGYDESLETWDVIVKYSGDILDLQEEDIQIVSLLNNYAVVTIPQNKIERFSQNPQIEYVEKPKRLFFAISQAKSVSCINTVQIPPYLLSGKDILVACVDSGVDYSHMDFRNSDGSTRIVSIWDQTIEGNPPEGYTIGTEYTREEINLALLESSTAQRYQIVPSRDFSGHGTNVMGIAAGNGREEDGSYRGVAYNSDMIVVKMGNPKKNSFPRTTELIQGIDYVLRMALRLQKPVALNISFGNSYGSHEGDTLLETYIDAVSSYGRSVICVGSGNEGSARGHFRGRWRQGEEFFTELSVGQLEVNFNVQLWKSYIDEVEFILESPSGKRVGPIGAILGTQRFRMDNTEILLFYGEPSPYMVEQEIYFEFLPVQDYIDSGIWTFRMVPKNIVVGEFDMWLPGGNVLNNQDTRFLQPSPDTTLTIPSAAKNVITVGAYNGRLTSYADFSGRGYTRVTDQIKPDLVAPGVDITTTKNQGGYQVVSGTSFATPFVTGSAALLMEWGIVNENDPYLYGDKVKAYLIKGARQLPGMESPNQMTGWGALCVRDSLPL